MDYSITPKPDFVLEVWDNGGDVVTPYPVFNSATLNIEKIFEDLARYFDHVVVRQGDEIVFQK